jgi:hypothetical protein
MVHVLEVVLPTAMGQAADDRPAHTLGARIEALDQIHGRLYR